MTDELLDFTGQVALITGGSRGLGRQMALALAARGADVVVTSRKVDACVEVAGEIEAMGRQALPYGCHVASWNQIDGLVEAAYERFGKIDTSDAGFLIAVYSFLDEQGEVRYTGPRADAGVAALKDFMGAP